MRALDGLRGIAIILVVLSHGWTLWPTSFITEHAWVEPFFRSGDAAVSIFLVASGFLLIRAISATEDRAYMQPLVVAVRRIVRVGPAMWVMLAVVMVVAAIDATDDSTKDDEQGVPVPCALTYSYNWLVQENLTGTRPDLGHLWYVSVDMQAVVFVAFIAFFLRHRPMVFLATLGVLFLALVAWRFHDYGAENIYIVLNRTTVRMDPFVIGALAGGRGAADAQGRRRLPTWRHGAAPHARARPVLVRARLQLPALGRHRPRDRRGGDACCASPWPPPGSAADRVPRKPRAHHAWQHVAGDLPLALSRSSTSSRRHADWPWGWKALAAFAATAVIAWVAQVLIERPVTRLLARPEWADLREGNLKATFAGHRSRRQHIRASDASSPRSAATPEAGDAAGRARCSTRCARASETPRRRLARS